MLQVMRMSVGNGQSHEDVKIVLRSEYGKFGIPMVFGEDTFAYTLKHELHLLHARQVNVIQFNKSRPTTPSAVKYKRLVLDDDSIYGPGNLIPESEYDLIGLGQFRGVLGQYSPIVFCASDGLLAIKAVAVADLHLHTVASPDGIITASRA